VTFIEESIDNFLRFRYPNDRKEFWEALKFREQDFQTVVRLVQAHQEECASRQHAIMGIGGLILMALVIIVLKVFTL